MGNEMVTTDESGIVSKIKEVIDIDPEDVLKDAREYGINVFSLNDLIEQPHNYVFIEKLMDKYATLAASYCALSGATSGVGGFITTITLAGADISNMAAQLYRLNQKMAVLNGFDINSPIHTEKTHLIYLKALGFDAAASAAIRTQVAKAALEQTSKSGQSANATIRLIMTVAKVLGLQLTKEQTVKFIPFIGAVIGGGLNYKFAQSAAKKMMVEYKSDYFDRWQISTRQI